MNLGPNPVNTTFQYLLNQSGTNITLGNNAAVNWDGANVVTRTGAQTISGIKTFASNIAAASFGNGASNNSFGVIASTNDFGGFATNYFGNSSLNNEFGQDAQQNTFGVNCLTNAFGDQNEGGDTINNFGSRAQNFFGDQGFNTFGGGSFNSGIKVLLPQFSGASSQAGQFGELRVSGSGLYVCTGTAGGWRRTFLQSF
jgi:hypothetical protein